MFSSLLQQTSRDAVAVDVAFVAGNGQPKTHDIVSYFVGHGLAVTGRPFETLDRFQFRGLVRNDQLRDCMTDWVWFADTDHVYHPTFIERLLRELPNHGHSKVVTAGRMSLPQEKVDRLVDENKVGDQPAVIDNAFARANELAPQRRMAAVGAGHTQIVRADQDNHDRVYVPPDQCRDFSWTEKYQKARSDIQFRRRCGGRVRLPTWFTQHQLHLNHLRDNEVGRHLEIQR